eukprot:COSAG01_NODE_534_length_15805_cov_9.468420_5_plen_71_part_00
MESAVPRLGVRKWANVATPQQPAYRSLLLATLRPLPACGCGGAAVRRRRPQPQSTAGSHAPRALHVGGAS